AERFASSVHEQAARGLGRCHPTNPPRRRSVIARGPEGQQSGGSTYFYGSILKPAFGSAMRRDLTMFKAGLSPSGGRHVTATPEELGDRWPQTGTLHSRLRVYGVYVDLPGGGWGHRMPIPRASDQPARHPRSVLVCSLSMTRRTRARCTRYSSAMKAFMS